MFVKIISLLVKELYGCYDYDIKFNSDVTFIYGSNGCGKTTILNITEAIITGQLYKLFCYEFNYIELVYSPIQEENEFRKINIKQDKNALYVNFDGEENVVDKSNIREDIRSSDRESRDVYRYYFNRYDILNKIKQTFNYVYLPLNRSSVLYDYEEDSDIFMLRRGRTRIPLENDFGIGSDTRDVAMMQIESLVNHNFSRINSNISKISDDFRNEILKSLLEVNRQYTLDNIVLDIFKNEDTISELQKTNAAYIKMLKELELLNKKEEEKYNKFFSEFIKEFITFQKSEGKNLSIDLVTKFQEISKIKDLIDIAEKMEQRKTTARKPIEIFLKTMNEFIQNSEDGKQIKIDSLGRVYFETEYNKRPISIQYLSSGEKQLMTFFANLIFNVKNSSSGIFVVDEPELSLHLSWQKIFVAKTLEINQNIQLIFATHSPEIIGKMRNKMYKLEKKYVDKGGNKDE